MSPQRRRRLAAARPGAMRPRDRDGSPIVHGTRGHFVRMRASIPSTICPMKIIRGVAAAVPARYRQLGTRGAALWLSLAWLASLAVPGMDGLVPPAHAQLSKTPVLDGTPDIDA